MTDNFFSIFDSMFYYATLGYVFTDSPWVVDEYIGNITKPQDRKHFYVNDKVLVAS